jgi:large subunit ribosomal protein L21
VYAIVECQGFQYRVTPDMVLRIPRTAAEPGSSVTLDRVLFLHDGNEARIGAPTVDNAKVELSILGHGREKKIVVGKYKRRKDYRRRKGHRSDYTEVQVTSIVG